MRARCLRPVAYRHQRILRAERPRQDGALRSHADETEQRKPRQPDAHGRIEGHARATLCSALASLTAPTRTLTSGSLIERTHLSDQLCVAELIGECQGFGQIDQGLTHVESALTERLVASFALHCRVQTGAHGVV